jgi:hypothetical protein
VGRDRESTAVLAGCQLSTTWASRRARPHSRRDRGDAARAQDRDGDVGGKATTDEYTDAVIARLKS